MNLDINFVYYLKICYFLDMIIIWFLFLDLYLDMCECIGVCKCYKNEIII